MKFKEAVCIISGGIKRNEAGEWVSSDFVRSDCGPLGSNIRLLAGYYLYEKDPQRIMIVSGGHGECGRILPEGLSLSGVLKRELIEHGVPEKSIIEENQSNNTYQQLRALDHIIKQHTLKRIFVVSNTYHISRIKAMLQFAPDLTEVAKVAETVFADDIVTQHDLSQRVVIDEAYNREPTLSVIAKEIEGVKQIKNGTYRFT